MMRLAALIWIVLGTTLAGMAVTVVLAVPELLDQGMQLVPIAAAAGFVIALPLSYVVARRIAAATMGSART